MPFKPPIGISDFRQLRQAGAGYIDKTRFILDVLETNGPVLLFPRPRRAELRATGTSPIHELAIVFDRKIARVEPLRRGRVKSS